MVPTKKGNYTFSGSALQFVVPIDSIIPSRTLSYISVFNSTGEEIDHKGSVISVLAGTSLKLVVAALAVSTLPAISAALKASAARVFNFRFIRFSSSIRISCQMSVFDRGPCV